MTGLKRCPECGAQYAEDDDCDSRFNQCLALEYENPSAYGAVHHLTVACYMLQHNRYSHRAWLEAREMLRQFVEEGVEPAEMRRANKRRVDSSQREWSIAQGPRFSGFGSISWTRTIADVRLGNPGEYGEDVKRWARAILSDTARTVSE